MSWLTTWMVEFETIFVFLGVFGVIFPKNLSSKLYHALSEQKKAAGDSISLSPSLPNFWVTQKERVFCVRGARGKGAVWLHEMLIFNDIRLTTLQYTL